MGRRYSRVIWSFVFATLGIAGTVYLVWEYETIAALGKFTLRWFYLLWEPVVEAILFTARLSVVRAVTSRFSWFAAGLGLRFVLEATHWERIVIVREFFKKYARIALSWWLTLHWVAKALSIVVSAYGMYRLALVHMNLVLLPLGFLIEPLFRRVRNWVVSETIGGVGPVRRFYNTCYRFTRIAMRRWWVVRAFFAPLRGFRYHLLIHARRWRYNYRKKDGIVRGTVRMWREREHAFDQKALAERERRAEIRRMRKADAARRMSHV